VDEAYRMYRSETGGENSQTYPALARVPGGLFGICVAGVSGSIYRAGDTGHEFTIMSVAKPFVFALVCEVLGDEEACAGINRPGGGDGRALRRRPSEPRRPRVMRRRL
jgi:glutaminase